MKSLKKEEHSLVLVSMIDDGIEMKMNADSSILLLLIDVADYIAKTTYYCLSLFGTKSGVRMTTRDCCCDIVKFAGLRFHLDRLLFPGSIGFLDCRGPVSRKKTIPVLHCGNAVANADEEHQRTSVSGSDCQYPL